MSALFELTSKNEPSARARARLLDGYQLTQRIWKIRSAAKQEPTLILLLQNEMNMQ